MKEALTPCEAAFKAWLEDRGGAVSHKEHNHLWQAFRAGWYAKQGSK